MNWHRRIVVLDAGVAVDGDGAAVMMAGVAAAVVIVEAGHADDVWAAVGTAAVAASVAATVGS